MSRAFVKETDDIAEVQAPERTISSAPNYVTKRGAALIDAEVDRLTELFKPKREVSADVTYVDLPAPPLSADGREPAEIPADQLARLRTADELLHVVRAFENPSVAHPLGNVDPWRDVEQLDLELGADFDAVLLGAGLDDCVHGSSGLVSGDRARRPRHRT